MSYIRTYNTVYRVVILSASCGAVYCNQSCLFVCGWVGGLVCVFVGGCVGGPVTTITGKLEIACIDPHQSESVGEGSDHLQLIKFWPYCAPGEGVCGRAKFFGSALLQPARSACVSLSAFLIYHAVYYVRCSRQLVPIVVYNIAPVAAAGCLRVKSDAQHHNSSRSSAVVHSMNDSCARWPEVRSVDRSPSDSDKFSIGPSACSMHVAEQWRSRAASHCSQHDETLPPSNTAGDSVKTSL